MTKRGWSVHTSPDGLRALQILPEIMPLYGVIADERMLGPSGVDLLEAIHRIQSSAHPDHPLKLVLLTGYDIDPETQARCDAIGARYFQKGDIGFSDLSRTLG